MNRKKDIIKVFRAAHQLLLAMMLVFSLIAASFAWFTFYRQSDTPATFGGGTIDDLKFEIGVVAVEENEIDREFYILNEPLGVKKPIGFEELESENGIYQIEMQDIDFGVIDNVTVLKPENIIYLRLTIPKKLGNKVSFSLQSDSEGDYYQNIYQTIYDQNGEESGQQNILDVNGDAQDVITSLNTIEQVHGSFINFQFSMTDVNNGNSMNGSGINFGEVFYDINEDIIINNEYSGGYKDVDGEEYYYLYIKLSPNLISISYAAQHLTKYMPCYMTFSIKAMFEISPE